MKQLYRSCKLQVTGCNSCIGTVVLPPLQTLGSKSVNFYPILMIEGSIWGFLGLLNPFLPSKMKILKLNILMTFMLKITLLRNFGMPLWDFGAKV